MSLKEALHQTDSQASRHLLGGTARIFATDALLIPTSMLIAAYLSRRFGPGGYGLLTLASVLVIWVESNIATALSRPAIKLVSESKDWQAVGSAVLRLYLLAGCGLGLTIWALATPLAVLMDEGALAGHLIAIPLAGAMGAALITTCFAIAGALVSIGGLYKLWRISFSTRKLRRSFVISALAYVAAASLSATGLALKLACAGLFVIVVLLLMFEFSEEEISGVRAGLRPHDAHAIEVSESTS